MTLLEREDRAASYDAPGAARETTPRRRWRVLWGLATVGLVVAWVASPAMVRIEDGVTPRIPVEAGLLVPEYGAAGTYALHYRHRETVTITVPVRNRGPLPLRLRRIGLDSAPLPLLVPAGDNLPVTLGPWETAEVSLTLRFDNCRHYHERSADTWDRVVVDGSVLGRGFESDVVLAWPLAVHGQVINHCPDRTLTRGDDARPLR